MSEIHDVGMAVCPGCGQADRVAAVPAVCLAGRDAVQVRVPARGEEPARTTTREVTTALAQALAPVPPKEPANGQLLGGLAAVLILFSTFGVFVAASAPSPSEGMIADGLPDAGTSVFPDMAWVGWLAGFGYLVAATLIGARVVRRNGYSGRLAGRQRAEALWSRGWYCARCGTVHFRPSSDVPSGALPLGEFRRLVWSEGGYGDLAAKYSVV